jgi:hypothetical protein
MPRGGPDWSNDPYQTAVTQTDIGALIAVLRGITSADGKGRIWLFDTFKDGIGAWETAKQSDAALAVASTAHAEVAPNSLLMDGGTGAGGSFCMVWHNASAPGSPRQGLELGVFYSTAMPKMNIQLNIIHGSNWVSGWWIVDPATHLLSLVTPSGPLTVDILPIATSSQFWLPIKVVIDADTQKFVSCTIGNIVTDLSAYSLNVTPIPPGNIPGIDFKANGVGASSRYLYVGHVIATCDEP